MSIQANDLKRGMHVYYNSAPCRVLEVEIRSPGKGRAFVQVKLRNILDGTQREVKFSTADQVDEAAIETREMDYLYSDAEGAIFMDSTSYEQMTLSDAVLGDAKPWLAEHMKCWVELLEGSPIGVTLPKSVEVTVRHAEATMKGQTAAKQNKPAVLENGVAIQVPSFVESGQRIRVDPTEKRYLERVK